MSEPKRSKFLPRWARDGRWELSEMPNVGPPDEGDEPYPDSLEAWVRDVYGHMSPEAQAVKVTELEPARDYVERVLLPGFDPAKESWREYRNWYSSFVEHTAEERRTNPRPIG